MLPGILPERQDSSSSARAWLTLCCVAMLQFLIAVDVTVVNVALPSIGADFDVSGLQLTWVVVGYTITGGGLLMLGGRLGDVLGRRRMLLLGTAVFGAASLLAGLAPSFPLLVAARLSQGAGEAIASPAAMAVIVLMFPEGPRRTRALGVWAAVASCGLVLGSVLSGVITELVGWRWIFLVAVPFIVVVLVGVALLVPADPPVERTPLDLPGSLLLTAAPLLFTYGVAEAGEKDGALPWLPPAALLGAVIAGFLFVRVERRAANPLIPLSFFRNRPRVLANLATALLSAALSSSFLLFTYYLQNRLGTSPLEAGLMMVPLAVSLIAASVFVPKLLGRWGARVCALAGIGFTGLAMAAIALVTHLGASGLAMIPAMLLIAAGMGFGIVGLQYAAVTGVTESDAGIASGVQRAADQLGGSTGVTLYVGIGFAPALTSTNPFLTSSLLAVAGLVAAAVVAWRIAVPAPESEAAAG
ncbi:MFS transporter [Streptoalloteichus hindustanus]|uniref:MFS transporter, DHA2 family, lincomycin resistance protein n=1 Tax=Streptoalloteichus hindustanus TaxID=2017 RepID=A0A1M4ZHU4_STRHI|nr:MFS transporter [Streptoalloteichus hindustanus]SHF17620.1 MFS transporter, DHA2 family, lincomycin resistance protein [Streptoalloteichus hindustanus]